MDYKIRIFKSNFYQITHFKVFYNLKISHEVNDIANGANLFFAEIEYADDEFLDNNLDSINIKGIEINEVEGDLIDQIFEVFVADFSKFALNIYHKSTSTEAQMQYCLQMIKKPVHDTARFERVWQKQVYALKGSYEMPKGNGVGATLENAIAKA